ncbi:hypothetical protein [Lacinutrix salivirga]
MSYNDYSQGKEVKRINDYNKDEYPTGPKIIMMAHNVENPEQVLAKTKEVMLAVSQFAYTDDWPSDEEWKTILPEWFVSSMTNKTSKDRDKDPNQWHYESWVHNIKMRSWVWWSSKIGEDYVKVTLEALDMPYLHDSFKYIFYSQGIPMKNITDDDDIYNKTS